MLGKCLLLGLCLAGSALFAQENSRKDTGYAETNYTVIEGGPIGATLVEPAGLAFMQVLGRLETGGTAYFVQNHASGEWGIEISGAGAPMINQAKPARLEVYRADNDILQFAAGYKTVEKSADGLDARADIPYGSNVVFHIRDHWSLAGAVVSVSRKVEVTGNAPGGFDSSVVFAVDPSVHWTNVNCLAPGAIYGDPTYDGDRSPGGTLNYAAQRFSMREDILPAPLFALSFASGASVTVLDPSPRGDSTVAETKLTSPVMTDTRFQFGALGAWQTNGGPIEFGFTYPGTSGMYAFGTNLPARTRWIRRYHPIQQGVAHGYEVSFRFGQNESFREVEKNSWRWAWDTLKPAVYYIDVEQMRRVLIDHLEAQAATIDGRTAIPFAIYTLETNKPQWNWTMAEMGFVAKNIECADQLLREGDRDPSERGQKMRATGLAIISSMIRALPTVPLQGTGYDLATGKSWTGDHHEWLAPWLRQATEDMRVLMRAYRRERTLGREHPEWFAWVKQYVDWLIQQQRADGSFPRRWKEGSNEVAESTGTTSYCPVPLLVIMSEETGDPKYQQSALRAAEYIWTNFGSRGLFVGGASDNPNITDKEAGMLSMEAFLSLYDSTKDAKWLERAQAAANYAETYIWIWNLPMPLDATDAQLDYKKGVPTIGVQGITTRGAGGADEYLDWAVPSYAKLYNLTKDPHYLDVARVLLHDTKSMVALPGRQYDMRGIGWQQEGWSMGPGRNGRGVGGHRFWLPWISANHLYGITGLEEYDPVLFKMLSEKPAANATPSAGPK
jgi:hypothetical protein